MGRSKGLLAARLHNCSLCQTIPRWLQRFKNSTLAHGPTLYGSIYCTHCQVSSHACLAPELCNAWIIVTGPICLYIFLSSAT